MELRNQAAWAAGTLACALCVVLESNQVFAQEARPVNGKSAVVPAANNVPVAKEEAADKEHPLDGLLKWADEGLTRIRTEVKDYSAVLVRRERIKGKLGDYTYIEASIRNRVKKDDEVVTPFAVHLRFLKPASLKDREVVWVEGRNNGKMWVQETPVLGLKIPPLWLVPTGALAMADNKYPITDIGLENLLMKLKDKGTADRARNRPTECEVKFQKGAKIDDRVCTLATIKHTVARPEYEFYRAEIFIDDELQLPIRYAAYSFPTKEGEDPPVEEEYTYTKLKVNVDLDDTLFDRK
jgi:hypothetical protein